MWMTDIGAIQVKELTTCTVLHIWSKCLIKLEHLVNLWPNNYHQPSLLALKTNRSGSQAYPPIHFTRFASIHLRSLSLTHYHILIDAFLCDPLCRWSHHSHRISLQHCSILTLASLLQDSEERRLRRLPSEAGPHVRLCRFAAGLDEPTLIYGEALPCHPPYTHINPSYSIWQRRKKP